MTNTKLALPLLLTLIGCGGPVWPDLPWNDFHTPVPVEEIEMSQLDLADNEVTYFEIRDAYDYDETCVSFHVRVAIGEKCAGASDAGACETEFDAMTLDEMPVCSANTNGLRNATIQGMPYMNPSFTLLAINRGDLNEAVEYSADALAGFLGPIDTEAEASLFLSSEGYYWNSTEIEDGAVRSVDDGYEFITTRRISSCDPIEDERVLLHVHADGEIEELRSQVSSSEDECIAYDC